MRMTNEDLNGSEPLHKAGKTALLETQQVYYTAEFTVRGLNGWRQHRRMGSPDFLIVLQCTVEGQNGEDLGSDETQITVIDWIVIETKGNKVRMVEMLHFYLCHLKDLFHGLQITFRIRMSSL